MADLIELKWYPMLLIQLDELADIVDQNPTADTDIADSKPLLQPLWYNYWVNKEANLLVP